MQSLRSKIFIFLIRNRHLFKGRLKKEVVGPGFSVDAFRAEVDKATQRMKLPKGVSIEKQTIGGINAEWIIPDNALSKKVLLYIHGGGFISGSCDTHRTHVAKFALGCRQRSLLFDYRLAPEHPFPAAVDDCVTVFKWLLKNGCEAQDIIMGGESAGATLTLSLLLALKEQNIDMPGAAFSISPVTDLRCQADSFRYNAKKDIAPMGSWDVWTKLYIADSDPVHPLLSPQMGDLTGFPPLHFCIGTHEIHFDDCVNITGKAMDQGVDVVLSKWAGMVHAFPIMAPLFPEATKAFNEICQFVQKHARD